MGGSLVREEQEGEETRSPRVVSAHTAVCPGLPQCGSELQLPGIPSSQDRDASGTGHLTAALLPAQQRSPAQRHEVNLTAATRPNRCEEYLVIAFT